MSAIGWPRLNVQLVPVRDVVRVAPNSVPLRKRCIDRTCFHCGYRGGNTLLPVDGLDGKYECPNVTACEERLLSGALV
jgi:hypothetical protein